jgi:hypothetical protein
MTGLTACGLVSGLDDLELMGGDGGGSVADASRDAIVDDARPPADAEALDATDAAPRPDAGPPNRCPSGRGPAMARITAIDGRRSASTPPG